MNKVCFHTDNEMKSENKQSSHCCVKAAEGILNLVAVRGTETRSLHRGPADPGADQQPACHSWLPYHVKVIVPPTLIFSCQRKWLVFWFSGSYVSKVSSCKGNLIQPVTLLYEGSTFFLMQQLVTLNQVITFILFLPATSRLSNHFFYCYSRLTYHVKVNDFFPVASWVTWYFLPHHVNLSNNVSTSIHLVNSTKSRYFSSWHGKLRYFCRNIFSSMLWVT